MCTDPFHEHDAEMRSIRIAIKLLDRLCSDDWYERMLNRHSKKWGESEYWFTPTVDGKFYTAHFRRSNALFEKAKKQEFSEYHVLIDLEHSIKTRDKRLLFAIMDKYLETWWT